MKKAIKKMIKTRMLIINKRFQMQILSFFLLHSLILSLVFIALSFMHFNDLDYLGQQLGLAANHPLMLWTNTQNMENTKKLFLAGAIITTISGIFSIVFSLRIAGPLYRLNVALRLGKKTKLSFRRHDYFQELAEAFNQMNELQVQKRAESVEKSENVIQLRTDDDAKPNKESRSSQKKAA